MRSERRPVLRRHLSPPTGSFQAESVFGVGSITNLTQCGLFLKTATLPPVGESVRVLFADAEGTKIEVHGRVVWTTDQLPPDHDARRTAGFGMQLDEPPAEFLEFFEYVLSH